MSQYVYSEGGIRYQQFIDEFVDLAQGDVNAVRIRVSGHAERTNEEDLPLEEEEIKRKNLLLSLNAADRAVIATMFKECRTRAVHDVLAHLQYKYTSGGLELFVDGVQLPRDPFWGEMHVNFVYRLDGEEWPPEA
ncbi:DUF6547 family protein [Mesorhizobium sp. IMUNJ 23232]|uniref:DUF6547 family protein n=1 Tax=Mesorhizobium sp. IMUNJ 23232 TaxID=3376064 RepID=UPI0037B50083